MFWTGQRPGWKKDQPVRAADARVVADLLQTASAPDGSPEFSELARPIIRADLARLRGLSSAERLTDEMARDVIDISLRAQCLLLPDDEVPTAACLML